MKKVLHPLMRTYADLSDVSSEDLFKELCNRGYDEHAIQGMFYAQGENLDHWDDEVHGYTEAGLHGAGAK